MAFLKNTVTRRFTATLAATATAFTLMTAAAVPAHADNRSDNIAKAVAAVAAIAIIGAALNEKNDRRDHRAKAAAPPPRHVPSPRVVRQEDHRRDQGQTYSRRATVLPAQCAIEVRDRRRSTVAYTERCLRRSGVDERLPRQCEISIDNRGRNRTAYDQNCLLNSGFRTQGRGRN